MKKKIYDYVCKHSHSSIHEIASALDMQELEALRIVHVLMKEGYVRMVLFHYFNSPKSTQRLCVLTGKCMEIRNKETLSLT